MLEFINKKNSFNVIDNLSLKYSSLFLSDNISENILSFSSFNIFSLKRRIISYTFFYVIFSFCSSWKNFSKFLGEILFICISGLFESKSYSLKISSIDKSCI